MVSKFALFTNLLLASVALAAPSSQLEARLARRRENRQSQPIQRIESPAANVSNVGYSSNRAGAVWDKSDVRIIPLIHGHPQSQSFSEQGTFTTVTGTFTVPALSGSSGAAAAWVGIDGDTCESAILQTGIDFTTTNGKVSYDGE